MTALFISQIFLWLIILVLSIVVFVLARQVGVLHERIAPAGALSSNSHVQVGDPSPVIDAVSLDDEKTVIGAAADKSTLLFFLSPDCPICKTLLPTLKSSLKSEGAWLRGVLVSDGSDVESHRSLIVEHGLEGLPYLVSSEIGIAFAVSKLPYAVLLDEKGIVRSLGMVNTREHLESLFNAKDLGVASIQEFLNRKTA